MSPRRLPMLLAVVCLSLSGCSTPQPILDLAEQGAATVGLAESSLREYVTVTEAQLAARMDLVQFDMQRRARDRAERQRDDRLDAGAGVTTADSAANLIRTLANEHRQIREAEATELAQIAQATTLDIDALTALPSEQLAAARKSFALLGEELSASEWIALSATYANEIADGFKALQSAGPDAAPPSD